MCMDRTMDLFPQNHHEPAFRALNLHSFVGCSYRFKKNMNFKTMFRNII